MNSAKDVLLFVAGLVGIAMVALVVMATVIGIGTIAPSRVDAQESSALEKRVATLEKELANLREHMDSKFQRGNYRMSEIEADVRERVDKDEEQDKRLGTGKQWMVELQRGYVDLLDRIMRLHPAEKTPEALRRIAKERDRARSMGR